jgi:ATP-dependent Lon protease
MEVIDLPGYTQDEKLELAERYLIQRQLDANGLCAEQASIDRDALTELVDGYTRAADIASRDETNEPTIGDDRVTSEG